MSAAARRSAGTAPQWSNESAFSPGIQMGETIDDLEDAEHCYVPRIGSA